MCRLLGYVGPPADLSGYLTAEACSLRALACEHGHGWGVAAWTAPHAPALMTRSPMAADKDPGFLRASSLRTPALLAHIRRASAGNVRWANNHPFVSGAWGFAHNGTVVGLNAEREMAGLDADLLSLRAGETDSEVAFLLFLRELRAAGEEPTLEQAARTLRGLALRLGGDYPGTDAQPTKLNFIAGNGEGFVATRWTHTLWVRESRTAAWIASEPMGPAEGWREVPDRSVLVARPGRVDVRPLQAP